jgi:uncharacterized protein DUF6603
MPAFDGLLNFGFNLADGLTVTIRSDLDLQGGVALLVRPGKPIDVLIGFVSDGTSAPVFAKGSIEVRADRSPTGGSASGADATPTILLGSPGATRLQVRTIGGAGGMRLAAGADVDMYLEVVLGGLEFIIARGDSDSFLAALIPAGGLGFGADLTVGVSHRDGFYFRGTSHLEIQIPAHLSIGPVEIQSLTVAANPTDAALPVTVAATFAASLGPVRAVVDRMGLTAVLGLRSGHDGNLGPIDVDLRFAPPRGIGLEVNASVVTGGGYLYHDPDQGEYAGAIELSIAGKLTLKAVGIIGTKMPDGSSGYSLLIIVSTEFATGFQLGFGFRLKAVGGLLGLHRGMNLAALTEGVRTGALQSVMFPKDIVTNAPKIISDLRGFFPAKRDTFLIGPMVKLEWGTPALMTISLGVVIEIPGNIAILGVLTAALPADDVKVIELNAAFLGAIEFDKQRLYFFASLFDSHIVGLAIGGEMGVLVGWGAGGDVIVTIGGFHPAYEVPPLPFPVPKRLTLDLLNTSAARIHADSYFALTPNTIQFGAHVDLFVGTGSFNVTGAIGIDALFHYPPFSMVADFAASLSVTVFGAGLFSVHVKGTLEGPRPWHIIGHGGISLLFWDLDVDFEKTWGDPASFLLPGIEVLGLILDELAKADSWAALPPPDALPLVHVRQAGPGELILQPTGGLRVAQRAVPLRLTLDRVGNSRPTDVTSVALSIGTGLSGGTDAVEGFALAQFRDMTDDEKLSQPAFTQEPAGVQVQGEELRTDGMVKRAVRYEEIIIDANFKRFAQPRRPYPAGLFTHFLGGAAVARSQPSRAVRGALTPDAGRVAIAGERFVVAFQDTNMVYAADAAAFTSAAGASDYLARAVADDPTLASKIHVIPSFEAAS